jgi:monoamine oxidase
VSDVNVVVVGAGISGLAVADGLIRAGRSVRVFEAGPTLGGRIRSVEVPGGCVDLGPTWFWPGEQRIARLVEEFGLTVHDQWTTGDALVAADGTVRRLDRPVMPPSYRFTNGAIGLVDGLTKRLPSGTVTVDCPVTQIERANDHVTVHTSGGAWTAGAVIIAVPPSLAMDSGMIDPDHLEPLVAEAASSIPVWMGGVTKAVAIYPEPFWRRLGLSGTAFGPGQPFGEVHDMSGPDGTPAMLFGFSQGSLSDPAGAFVDQLATLFGPEAAAPEQVLVVDWGQQPFTTPTRLGHTNRYDLYGSPHLTTPSWAGRLHWASTETATTAPGHIEGALAAAERTLAALLTP